MERPFKGFFALKTTSSFGHWMPVLTTATMTALFGQFYLQPFQNDFRFSMGVVAYAVLLFMYEKKWMTVIMTAIAVGFIRIQLSLYIGDSLQEAMATHTPAMGYYFTYGCLFYWADLKERLESPIIVVLCLMGIDMFSNLVELMFRTPPQVSDMGMRLASIGAYGVFRSVLSLIIYFVIRFYPELIYKQRQKRMYYQMVIDHGRLSNEIVFLKKSEQEIESAMSEAFDIYAHLKSADHRDDESIRHVRKALDLSRGIHDIKKDYRRIRAGLESMVPEMQTLEHTEMGELISVLCEDLEVMASRQSKQVNINSRGRIEVGTEMVYPIIGILGNLIVNAIEAMAKSGNVMVEAEKKHDVIRLVVMDDGVGIENANLPRIFDPGFSTKFDPTTGKMNTGMGLSQVKFIVEDQLGGTVGVTSRVGKGTRFIIEFKDAGGQNA